ncbi:MAG: 50S ribosomal protein L10 [Holosporales bacterium]|jgi:large subunit ribosomal protein L10|nr:50S ribosomal protein L10 [Holosporales bacterium]
MDRVQKRQLIDKLKEASSEANLAVLVKYNGLTVAEALDLRNKMRAAEASYVVVKNTLARIALSETKFGPMTDLFKGQTAIAISQSPVAAAKVAVEFAKEFEEKFEIIAGCMDGQVLSISDVKMLASLPSLDGLRSKIIAIISASAQKIAAVLQAPAGQLARLFGAYSSKG